MRYAVWVREAHMSAVLDHISDCPRCSAQVVPVLDGKMGAWRRVCANMDGFWQDPDLGVTLNSGCPRQAPAGRLRCKECSPTQVHAPIPQTKVHSMRPVVREDESVAMEYKVRCHDPDDDEQFNCYLPRGEILPTLLEEFEQGLLRTSACPPADDDGKKHSTAGQPRADAGKLVSASPSQPSAPKASALSSTRKISKAKAKNSSCKAEEHSQETAWLHVSPATMEEVRCPVDKDSAKPRIRRQTGGIITCVLSCGMLFDWMELWKGESLQLVYCLALRSLKATLKGDKQLQAIFSSGTTTWQSCMP